MRKLSTKKIVLSLVVVAVAVAIPLIFLKPKPVEEVLPVVGVDVVRTRNVEIYGEFPGKIRAQQFVEVRARVEGYLEKMMFEEGTRVEKDQVLFIIDPKQYKAQVDRAEALVTKNKAIALKAERDLARIRPLFEQKAASQLDLDNAIAAYESAKADVHVSEANLTEARLALSYTTVRSPISGGSRFAVSSGQCRKERHRVRGIQDDRPRLSEVQGQEREPRAEGYEPSLESVCDYHIGR